MPIRMLLVCLLALLVCCALPAHAAAPARPANVWFSLVAEGGFIASNYQALQITDQGVGRLHTKLPPVVTTTIRFTPEEMIYLRALTRPALDLQGKPISHMGADLPRHTLFLRQGKRSVSLEWLATDNPDLLATQELLYSLVNRESYRYRLLRGRPQDVAGVMFALVNGLRTQLFRPDALRPAIMNVLSRWPIAGLTREQNEALFADTAVVLSQITPREEWSGTVIAAVGKLSSQPRAEADIALSHAVSTPPTEGREPYAAVPWTFLTPLFVQQYQALRALPPARLTPPQSQALTVLSAALQALDDPRAKAALGLAPAAPPRA